MTTITDVDLEVCQEKIGYVFKYPELLRQALTHASISQNRVDSNERLEFLGDAILGMIVCHELYERFPDYLEGELTKIKSMIVSRRICGRLTNEIGLSEFLCVGKGMSSQTRLPNSCTAAAMESIIGAIFIDGGLEAARDFICRHFAQLFDKADARHSQENYKSLLQQYAQRTFESTPIYEVLDEKGPDHSKCFEVGVVIGRQRYASAWGPNKKEAEQLAAFCTLQQLEVIPSEAKHPSMTAIG